MSQKYHFVVISGNIAVGKTTLSQRLAVALQWKPYMEDFTGNPYLADFYDDMAAWSFHSQIFFLARRLQHHHAITHYPGHVLQDRSVYEDAEIFAHNLYLRGLISARDYDCYRALYDGVSGFLPPPSLVIYLQAPVSLLIERIKQRGRDYEQMISAQYLDDLNQLYEDWIGRWSASPLLRLKMQDYDILQDADAVGRIIQQVQAMLPSSDAPGHHPN